MENKESFASNRKYNCLSESVKQNLLDLDNKLYNFGYCYNSIWRDDKESGGNVFVFELLENNRKRKNVKNLITLRPQKNYLKVEVYWGEKDKHFYNKITDDLFQDITKRFEKIGIPLE